jgi:hypothetical protein
VTTALEAYLTGVVTMSLKDMKPLTLVVVPVLDDQGQVNGIVNLYDPDDGQRRASITITEHDV